MIFMAASTMNMAMIHASITMRKKAKNYFFVLYKLIISQIPTKILFFFTISDSHALKSEEKNCNSADKNRRQHKLYEKFTVDEVVQHFPPFRCIVQIFFTV